MKCPNCGGEIGRTELAPNCKHCGINIFYSQQEHLLTNDAKRCELEYASFRILVEKLKTAFIKGALPITRLVFTVLSLCAVLIPFAEINVEIPLVSKSLSFGAIGVYSAYSDGIVNAFIDFMKGGYSPEIVTDVVLIAVSLVLVLLVAVVILVVEILSFINIRKTAGILRTVSVIGIVFSVLASAVIVKVCFFDNAFSSEGLFNISLGYGSFVAVLIFAANFIINHLFIKKDVKPLIKDVDIQRIEMRKRIKAGEITLEELPLPVFESDEERLKRLEQEETKKKMADEAKGGEMNG